MRTFFPVVGPKLLQEHEGQLVYRSECREIARVHPGRAVDEAELLLDPAAPSVPCATPGTPSHMGPRGPEGVNLRSGPEEQDHPSTPLASCRRRSNITSREERDSLHQRVREPHFGPVHGAIARALHDA